MGALERLEKGQSLRPLDWQELSAAVGRNEALRLVGEVRAARGGVEGLHTGRSPLPADVARWLLRLKSRAALLARPGDLPGRLARRFGRAQARRVERILTRSTGSRARARERSQRRRGRR
jgi:hypothetical protein